MYIPLPICLRMAGVIITLFEIISHTNYISLAIVGVLYFCVFVVFGHNQEIKTPTKLLKCM